MGSTRESLETEPTESIELFDKSDEKKSFFFADKVDQKGPQQIFCITFTYIAFLLLNIPKSTGKDKQHAIVELQDAWQRFKNNCETFLSPEYRDHFQDFRVLHEGIEDVWNKALNVLHESNARHFAGPIGASKATLYSYTNKGNLSETAGCALEIINELRKLKVNLEKIEILTEQKTQNTNLAY